MPFALSQFSVRAVFAVIAVSRYELFFFVRSLFLPASLGI